MVPDQPMVIPLPVEMTDQPGTFFISPHTIIQADPANQWNAIYLQSMLAPTGFPLPIQGSASLSTPTLMLQKGGDLQKLGKEGYHLSVNPQKVLIEAPEPAGVFYAIQTFRQMLLPLIEDRTTVHDRTWLVPCVEIFDYPRFPWRGYMLDEGRHFQGKESVLRTLDLMALQKLNVLHWHLTEDQGWRIYIKKYPKLTSVGSKRAGTSAGFTGKHNGIPHEGFYSPEEIKEIIKYAAKRQILIVPEIEMPGHCLAALASFPELSCTGGPFEVATHFGIYPHVYCAGKAEVFTFLQNILDEIMELFPSPYIHIGGDEVLKGNWKKCPDCQKRIQQEGLKDAHDLQTYFTNRMVNYLAEHGRQAIVWNEALKEGLSKEAVIQYWVGNRKGVLGAIRGHQRSVIISSYMDLYLDHSYSLTPLSRAYKFEPVFKELGETETGSILGLEAPLWSEFVPNRPRQDYQTYPRLTAFAETGWSPKEAKNLNDFKSRLSEFQRRLDEIGVGYAPENEVEPSKLKQWLGVFTIVQPQTKTAGGKSGS